MNRQAKKQAVLLIHGIGEQRPMETLWSFVDLVWLKAPARPGAPARTVYSEPDEISGVYELRRLSTNYGGAGKRTDFYEFYWAHLMHGNVLSDVLGWLAHLALRKRASVPPQLHKAWTALRFIVGGFGFAIVLAFATSLFAGLTGHVLLIVAIVAAFLAAFAGLAVADQIFFSPVLGDAARYLRPAPKNIGCRQQIRESGLRLIDALHRSGKYDRIVLVGHSLGGVIAYELALHYWGTRNRLMDREGVQAPLAAAEAAARALAEGGSREDWLTAQHALWDVLRREQDEAGAPLWLISDLITLGSPLAHAETLLAQSPEAFQQLLERREIAADPPQMEIFTNGARRFSYCRRPDDADDPGAAPRAPHNSAVFSATRWTNIFFPMQGILRGDLVGGPCAPVYGPGVLDIAACAPVTGGWFPHMHYFRDACDTPWGDPAWVDHRKALRSALALDE
ncbi:MAG: alpha/beta fold hydrolase [Hyphomonadaceae bacterium]